MGREIRSSCLARYAARIYTELSATFQASPRSFTRVPCLCPRHSSSPHPHEVFTQLSPSSGSSPFSHWLIFPAVCRLAASCALLPPAPYCPHDPQTSVHHSTWKAC